MTSTDAVQEERDAALDGRIVAECDWLYLRNWRGRRLHHVEPEQPARLSNECVTTGVTACGIRGEWRIPGLMSRMGVERCARCCAALGILLGTGSPKNDEFLKPWLAARLAAIREAAAAPSEQASLPSEGDASVEAGGDR